MAGNAELTLCDPTADVNGDGPCGAPELGCLRTSVVAGFAAEGVCLMEEPCTTDGDCPITASTCETSLIRRIYTQDADLLADHLSCLQQNCQSGDAACAPGHSCLPFVVPAATHAPDICVLNCDSNGNCPPSFSCDQKVNGPANPAVCIPGLLGFSCGADLDCLMGRCLNDDAADPAAGLNTCSVACSGDGGCTQFDSSLGLFVCANGHCETPSSYTGTSCLTDADCTRDPDTICAFQTPPYSPSSLGNCLRACPAQGTCPARGGIGHTCLPFFDSSGLTTQACYPGYFGYPCTSDTECVGDLTCLSATCSTVCATDDDCNADRWSANLSYCSSSSICAPLLAGGVPCAGADQCQSRVCASAGAGAVDTCGGIPASAP